MSHGIRHKYDIISHIFNERDESMLQIKEISKKYITGDLTQVALDKVSLNLRDNEFVAILGPSGSGKTTLLNIIGGLDRYDSGDLIINGISTKKYKDKDWDSYRNHTIGFVFQSYNLIPHQTLLSNVELALTISGISKSERKQRAMQALDQVGLASQYHKKPNQLSGGQMQRVAIARALVNDPDILLADEPTGALDSDTSVQVMDLLQEVAKDRLVVMVTHNPELANSYATRIVNLKDGKIISDSHPYVEENESFVEYKNMGKSSMSLLTSLSLSFNNLKTKKARTILTSFAGSIGIIGIALILSLSNGVNSYIKSIEEETLSEYPLQIQSTGFDMTSMMVTAKEDKNEQSKGDIHVTEMLTNMFSKIGSNDLESLKKYLDGNESDIHEYTNSIEYNYNIKPQIFLETKGNYRQVNPDKSFSALGMGSSQSTNSMMSMVMSTDVFAAMPSLTSLFSDQYEVKAGKWPTSNNECVLVLTSKGNISDFLSYTLGLRDASELDEMIHQFYQEEDVTVPKMNQTYDYKDILGITFKRVNASDYYQYDKEFKVWKDKTNDEVYMKELVSKGEDLKIVGIVQAKEGMNAVMLAPGIYYPASLTTQMIQEASSSDIVMSQMNNKNINVFTGKSFDSNSKENPFDMNRLFSIDQNLMKSAFKFDQSKLNMKDMQLNEMMSDISLPSLDLKEILNEIEINIQPEQMNQMMLSLIEEYQTYLQEHPENDFIQSTTGLFEYLQSSEVNQIIQSEIERIIQENGEMLITSEQMQEILQKVMNNYDGEIVDGEMIRNGFVEYINSNEAKTIISKQLSKIIEDSNINQVLENVMKDLMTSVSSQISQTLQSNMNELQTSMTNAFSFDTDVFARAIHVKMSEEELSELMASMMSKEIVTYEGNLKKLGYADLDKPFAISIYPKDFESKEQVLSILDGYNASMKEKGYEEKVISYTDVVGALMTSVTDIINVISYVLVAFVAISLIVSSIMIGVITYISVLERKKEIGILRAIGASKKNISQVFNAETFIIGLLSGIMGIGVTLMLLVPGNQIIHAIAKNSQINAILPVGAGIILIVLSTILTLIGGLIPSKKAAKEDPVTALRSE